MGAESGSPGKKDLMSATRVQKVCGELRATTFPHPKPITEKEPLFYGETCGPARTLPARARRPPPPSIPAPPPCGWP